MEPIVFTHAPRATRTIVRPALLAAALAAGTSPALGQDAADAGESLPGGLTATVQDFTELRPEPLPVADEVIVKFVEAGGEEGRSADFLSADGALDLGLEPAPRSASGGTVVYRLRPDFRLGPEASEDADRRIEDVAAALSARPDVEFAQVNWILTPHQGDAAASSVDRTPDDPGYPAQWHYHALGVGTDRSAGGISLPSGWSGGVGQRDVVVAVLDTGILPAHEDVAGASNIGGGYDMITDPARANDGDGRDADPTDAGDAVAANECGPGRPARGNSWHGTHVGGTIGAGGTDNATGVAGINWSVRLMSVRVLGRCGGSTVDINDGIRWAAGLSVPGVPDNPTPARVINMSLGAPVPCSASPSTQAAIDDAAAAGALVVVSAGNDAMDAAGAFPASCDNVLTVAASDARGHLAARYSNFGAVVDILAPGGDVRRDDDGDGTADGVLSLTQGGYSLANGTSMAAPHVSGVAALVFAAEPGRTAAEVEALLKAEAAPRDSAACPQPCGAGLLSAAFLASDEPVDPPEEGRITYQFAAKMVCGFQKDLESLRLARGVYGTAVNIRNPSRDDVILTKRLELAYPEGMQTPGRTFRVARDVLPPATTLSTSCDDIAERVFGGSLPADYMDAFVVIESDADLDVSAVYTATSFSEDEFAGTSIDVERVAPRRLDRPFEEGGSE